MPVNPHEPFSGLIILDHGRIDKQVEGLSPSREDHQRFAEILIHDVQRITLRVIDDQIVEGLAGFG